MFLDILRRGRRADPLIGSLVQFALAAGLLGPGVAAAQIPEAAARPLTAALQAGQAEAVKLTWTVGRQGEAVDLLRIDCGRATLQHCGPGGEPAAEPGCTAIGSPLTLTAGQRGQLVSGLRAADLPHLRTADPESRAAVDRVLELAVATGTGVAPIGRWELGLSDWPTPPDGYGLAAYLDELVHKLRQVPRPPLAIPTTAAELAELRVQLRLTPRTRPGGLLTIEHGLVHVTPAEGSLPRSPVPSPWERPLQKSEEAELLKALQAAQLDRLDQVVQKRAAPAIGDDDGRLATLHLVRADPVVAKGAIAPAATPLREEPRGIERYLADLMRSSARPLFGQLVELLLAPPPAPPARASKSKPPAR